MYIHSKCNKSVVNILRTDSATGDISHVLRCTFEYETAKAADDIHYNLEQNAHKVHRYYK